LLQRLKFFISGAEALLQSIALLRDFSQLRIRSAGDRLAGITSAGIWMGRLGGFQFLGHLSQFGLQITISLLELSQLGVVAARSGGRRYGRVPGTLELLSECADFFIGSTQALLQLIPFSGNRGNITGRGFTRRG